jgi:hypothetical protein
MSLECCMLASGSSTLTVCKADKATARLGEIGTGHRQGLRELSDPPAMS